MFCCLIVHDVELRFETFLFKHGELVFICVKHCDVREVVNGGGKNAVGFVMVHDEMADGSVERHEREVSCHVVIDDATVFVGEYSETEYVSDRSIAIVGNEGWSAVALIPLVDGLLNR